MDRTTPFSPSDEKGSLGISLNRSLQGMVASGPEDEADEPSLKQDSIGGSAPREIPNQDDRPQRLPAED